MRLLTKVAVCRSPVPSPNPQSPPRSFAMNFMISMLVASSVFAAVWQARGEAPAANRSTLPPSVVEGNNQFAIDLYHRLAGESNGNVFVSPESISLALAMTYAG